MNSQLLVLAVPLHSTGVICCFGESSSSVVRSPTTLPPWRGGRGGIGRRRGSKGRGRGKKIGHVTHDMSMRSHAHTPI